MFRKTAMRILQEYSDGLERLRREACGQDKRSLSGVLKIYSSPVSQQVLLPALLAKFGRKYPNYTIEVITSSRYDTCCYVRDAYEDNTMEAVGFIGQLYRQGSPIGFEADMTGLNLYPVLTSQLAACVSAGSPLARQKKISLKTASSYPLVLFTVNGQEDYEKLFHGHSSPRVTLAAFLQYRMCSRITFTIDTNPAIIKNKAQKEDANGTGCKISPPAPHRAGQGENHDVNDRHHPQAWRGVCHRREYL